LLIAIGALGVIYYYSIDLQLIFSFLVAIATLVYAYLTAQLVKLNKDIRDIQKKQLYPNINIDFQNEEHNMNLINIIIENIGKSTAYDVHINIKPDIGYYKNKKLSDLPIIKNNHDLPANKRIKFFLTNLLENTEDKIKEPFKISVDYKNEKGKQFNKEFEIDLNMLSGALYSAYTPIIDMRNFLNDINKNIEKLVEGKEKIKIIRYTKEEANKEKIQNIQDAKNKIEKMKKK